MSKLPDKLSDLIALALRDLEACEQDPDYKIDMEFWHAPKDGVCLVCLAGAVLSQSCGVEKDVKMYPSRVDSPIRRKLYVLDAVRCSNMAFAFYHMEQATGVSVYAWGTKYRSCYITPYEQDKDAFKRDLRNLVTGLRKDGL
jgi:hypothetical protein